MMSIGAGWISGRAIRAYKKSILPIIGSVIVSGALNLAWILIFILQPEPWFSASIVIPITGMVMANSMNAVSLCAERYWSERSNQYDHQNAAKTAMTAAMIPQINALLAVGIVSLPGMMTGQILSGVSPLIAVRYQIVIMAMILSTAAFGSFLYLWWYARNNEA
jgi:putative ABC transport system permease protein